MLHNKFEMPLDLIINPSRIFYTYRVIIFVLSLISIFGFNALPLILQILLAMILIVSTVIIIRKNSFNKVSRLYLSKDHNWKLISNNNESYDVLMEGECIVTYFLIWLNFSSANRKKFHVLLFSDSASKALLRQLRVRLRFLVPAETYDITWNKV